MILFPFVKRTLKELRFGFCAEQNYRQIEGNHKIYTWEDKKNTKDVIIKKEGSRMVKDGED